MDDLDPKEEGEEELENIDELILSEMDDMEDEEGFGDEALSSY